MLLHCAAAVHKLAIGGYYFSSLCGQEDKFRYSFYLHAEYHLILILNIIMFISLKKL